MAEFATAGNVHLSNHCDNRIKPTYVHEGNKSNDGEEPAEEKDTGFDVEKGSPKSDAAGLLN